MDTLFFGLLWIKNIFISFLTNAVNLGSPLKVFTQKQVLGCSRSLWRSRVSIPSHWSLILTTTDAAEIADRAALFKLSSKQLGAMHGIVPSFMAKPHAGLPGTSGHIHISLVDAQSGENLFVRKEEDTEAQWKDIKHLSDLGRYL